MCKKKDPNKKGFFGEFKEFITRGNVLDMAVGVIIGGAFTAIVTALTSGILQPVINFLIGKMMGNASLERARTILGNVIATDGKVYDNAAQIAEHNRMYPDGQIAVDWAKTNYIDWGTFISAIINFLLVALILFCIIKAINTVHERGVAAKEKLEAEMKAKEEAERKAKEEEEARLKAEAEAKAKAEEEAKKASEKKPASKKKSSSKKKAPAKK